jgi:dUTP pyrophosphatase
MALSKGEIAKIPLGIAMEIPEGYEALVVPRSSTAVRHNVIQANSIGVIDESYCGDDDIWSFPAYALEDTFIPKHTRLCQFRLFKHQENLNFQEVSSLGNENRGGYGTTGI